MIATARCNEPLPQRPHEHRGVHTGHLRVSGSNTYLTSDPGPRSGFWTIDGEPGMDPPARVLPFDLRYESLAPISRLLGDGRDGRGDAVWALTRATAGRYRFGCRAGARLADKVHQARSDRILGQPRATLLSADPELPEGVSADALTGAGRTLLILSRA
jgi:hypothetical protein